MRSEHATQTSPPRSKAAPVPPNPLELSDRLISVAEQALDNPCNRIGLLSCAVPLTWIADGCDIELDVVPTVAAVARRSKGKKIRDWSYFTAAVIEARDKRLSGRRVAK